MRDYKVISTTIPANEALSGAVDIGDAEYISIETPADWAGTQITFQAKAKHQEDINGIVEDWNDVYDSAGNEFTVTVAANRVIVDIPELAPLKHIRVRSGTTATPVNHNVQRNIRFIVK